MKKGVAFAILAAIFYAVSSPLSKIMLNYMEPTLMAGFLYLGAGFGMSFVALFRKINNQQHKESKLTKRELPFTIAMILLDILAPICLLCGLKMTSAANASLLNNFEIVVTAIVAMVVFKEKISSRLWMGIILVTIACVVLSIENQDSFKFSYGSLLILVACICWGIENNCTKKISSKDPMQIVLLKGIFSGIGSIIIGLCIGERINIIWSIFAVLCIGFIAYGLSIFFYVYAQRYIGAARTSAFYMIAPFVGTALSLVIFQELPYFTYFIGLIIMIIGVWFCSKDEPLFKKKS